MFTYVFLCELLKCHCEINLKSRFGCWATNGLPQTTRDREWMLQCYTITNHEHPLCQAM